MQNSDDKTGRLEELDVGGGDFDGGGEEAGELDEEAFGAGAAEVEEVAAVAVKGAADDAYLASVHVGGYFVGAVVAYLGGAAYGMDEEGHVGRAHCYGCGLPASCVSVLEGGDVAEGFVEGLAGAAYKQKIGYYGALAALRSAGCGAYGPFQWGEHLKAFGFELFPSHLPGVRAPEIAQSVPLWLFRLWHERFFSGLHCWG